MDNPSDLSQSSSPFESPLQERVHKHLAGYVSPAIAQLYHDACEVRSAERPLGSAALLLGHLFREIDGAVRDALAPPPKQSADGEDVKVAHVQNIKLILKELDVEINDPRIALWLKFADAKDPWKLHKFAHRQGLGKLRKYDADFIRLCTEFDNLLDFVLDRLEASAAKFALRLDEALSNAPPAKKYVKRLFRERLPNAPFIFDRLFEKPLSDVWIDALLAAGFFSDPPPAAVQSATHFARELADRDIERATRILEELPEIIDAFMAYSYAMVATRLRPEQYAPLVKKLKNWIAATEFGALEHPLSPRFGQLLGHQARQGDAAGAIELLSVLTELRPSPDEESPFERRSLAQVDDDDYDELVREVVEGVAAVEPIRLIVLLCDRLNTAIETSLHVAELREPLAYDLSDHWLPGFGQRGTWFDLKSVLGQRTAQALRLAADAGFAYDELVESLRAHRFLVFDRLMLDLIMYTGSGSKHARAIITDASRYDEYRPTPEFAEFLHAFFSTLDAADRGEVERRMCSPMDRKLLRDDLTETELLEINELKAMNYLSTVEADLTAEGRADLVRLTEKHGARSAIVSELPPVAMAVGPDSPWTYEQFEAMSPVEIANALSHWTPPPADIPLAHPAQGAAIQLRASVSGRPETFAPELSSFTSLGPIYIEHLVKGFEEPLRTGRRFPWRPVIDFLRDVASFADAEPIPVRYGSASWSQVRTAICSLLTDGMSGHFDQIPLECAEAVLQTIEPMTTDVNPLPDDSRGEHTSPWHRSLSGTRSMATRALVRYAVWSREPALTDLPLTVRDGIRAMPSVRQCLERLSRDGADGVAAVFGATFPSLCDLDLTWATAIAPSVFPAAETEGLTNFAGWRTYVELCNANTLTFSLLAPCYRRAVREWPFPEEHDPAMGRSYAERLAEHALALFVYGITPLDELLVPLWDRLSAEAAAHGMLHVARIVHRLPESIVPPEIDSRIREFWFWRLSVVASNPGAHVPEIESFGHLFYVAKMDEKWRLDGLETALALTNGCVRPDHKIMAVLAAVSDDGLPKALICLDRIVQGNLFERGIAFWSEDMKKLLRRGVDASPTKRHAQDIAGRLIARRVRGFDEFIRKPQETLLAAGASIAQPSPAAPGYRSLGD